MRHGSIRRREFFWYHEHTFQLFEARKILVQVFDDAFIQGLHLGVRDEFFSRVKVNLVGPRPIFQGREVRRDQHGGKLPPVTEYHGGPNQRVQLQRILNRLRRDELAAGSLDQIFLAIRDGKVSVAVEVPDVARLEPAVHKRVVGFLRTIPIALEYRRPAHQNFAVVGNPHFDVRQRLADRPQFVRGGRVHRDHRRSFGQSVPFVDGNADIGIPLGQFAAQRRASGNELLRLSTHPGAHFGKNEPVRDFHFPGERCRSRSGQSLGAVSAPHRKRPAIDCVLRKARSLEDHLLANLFVHAGHANKNVGLHFRQSLGQLRDVRTIGQHHAAIEQCEIHVPRRHMGKWQKRYAHLFSFVPMPNPSIEDAMFDAMLPWVSMAPFGVPVVPEV